MKLLLDTNAFLWALAEPQRLSATVAAALTEQHELLLSLVTPWELAIKITTGKLTLAGGALQFVTKHAARNGIRILPIRFEHLHALEHLPLHHRDPFDRMLVAQAIAEGCTLVTSDVRLRQYSLDVLW